MTDPGPDRVQVPAHPRPGALVVTGLVRGALSVFLPVVVAAQAIALLGYAVVGRGDVWTWVRAGLALTLTSVRVAFDLTRAGDPRPTGEQLVVAAGALTIAVLVLSFRAGRAHGRDVDDASGGTILAGGTVALGFGVPAVIASLPATLTIDRSGLDRLQPVVWQALVLPVVVAGVAAGVGAASGARDAVVDRLGARVVAACRGGAVAFWWGAVLAFVALLVIAALSPKQVGDYARALDRASNEGAVAVAGQALLVPNASVLVLGTSMGATTTLSVGSQGSVALTSRGLDPDGAAGEFVLSVVGVTHPDNLRFPWWFAAIGLVPTVATIAGGRAAASGAVSTRERTLRGASSGLVYASLCAVGVWAASISVPAWWISGETVSLGVSPIGVAGLALLWGVLGGAVGGAIRSRPRLNADRA